MKQKYTLSVIIAVICIVIAGSFLYVALRPKEPTPQSATPAAQTEAPATTPAPTPPPVAKPGSYMEYSASALDAATGRRVLFFYAAWCPQCRQLEKTILEGTVPSGMTIFKVNYDTAGELRQKYGVTLQTTIVEIDASGNITKKHVAYDDPTLPAVLKALD